jgi:hypothetical protein
LNTNLQATVVDSLTATTSSNCAIESKVDEMAVVEQQANFSTETTTVAMELDQPLVEVVEVKKDVYALQNAMFRVMLAREIAKNDKLKYEVSFILLFTIVF